MINPMKTAMLAAAGMFVGSGAIAAPCSSSSDTSVVVDVQEAPLTMVRDLTLADLVVLSARLGRPPAHAVLGFYAGTVGYAVRSIEVRDARPDDGRTCPGFRLEANLVALDRRIAVANDLVGPSCHVRAVFEHYRHHAAAASLALHGFASELPAMLGPEIELHIRSQPGTPEDLRRFVDSLLDGAVDRFMTSLVEVQRGVDTESEIRRLSRSCDET